MSSTDARPAARARRSWLLWTMIAVITAGVIAAIATSEMSGTGAENVGSAGPEPAPSASPAPSPEPESASASSATAEATPAPPRDCEATESNPGGDNNYIEDAPRLENLGDGFVVTGLVRSAAGCRPLSGIPVQFWLATETGGEQDNRATVLTGGDGRFRIETDPTVPQFGEPNIHVAYDGDRYEQVFIRRVVDLEDTRATVNLTLARNG